jgi:glutamate/tyrosine decarboxylase-like PLP-dependent enzyme
MYTHYPAGTILFKRASEHALLLGLNSDGEGYMFKDDDDKAQAHRDFAQNTTYLGQNRFEGSMGGQGAAMLHLVIKHLGREGLGLLLDHNLDMTNVFAEEIRTSNDLRTSFDPELNTVCIEPAELARGNDARVEAVSAELERRYGIYLSTTTLPNRNGLDGKRKVFRFVASHPYTDADDVRYIAKALSETWREL